MIKARILIINILLGCSLCALTVSGYIYYGEIKQFSSVSLRYDAPISGRTAYAARQYSVSHSAGHTFWPTFWSEYKATVSGAFVTTYVDCIAFSGDASLVWPAKYITGAAPGVVDAFGCAVSEALAWRLWGSVDVIGKTVEIDGAKRVVRGVFSGKEEVALISFRDEGTDRSWDAVELAGVSGNTMRDEVESYASASGLGKPTYIQMGGLSYLAGSMAALPLLIPAVCCLCLVFGAIRKWRPAAGKLIPYILLLVLALVLPAILEILPEQAIPARWSDLSFWGSAISKTLDSLRVFLRVAPQSRDMELRMILLKQAGVTFLAVLVSITICFRWVGRYTWQVSR